MRAFAVDEFGGHGSVRDVPEPMPAEGQVRVRVEAASINPADLFMLGGAYKDRMPHHFPLIPGLDLGGTIDEVGPGVEGFQAGDPVFGSHGKMSVGEGTLAEYSIAMIGTIARRPDDVDPAFGTALSLAGVSALEVVDAAGLQPGDVVLIVGATGGIGSIATQLVVAAGARAIAVTRAVNHDYARRLGADEVIDYTSQDVFAAVRANHPEPIAAVFDMVGDKAANTHYSELVRQGGHVISMLGGADQEALSARRISGVNVMTRVTTDKLERLAALVAAGKLRRPEITTYTLADAGKALDEVGGHHVRGKLVIVP